MDTIEEMQLWMHPYPTVVKTKRTKDVNGKIYQDGSAIKLSDLYEARKTTPPQLKRCVLAVAKKSGGDTSKAFAICTSSLQNKGYLKQGTQAPTKKGAKAGRSKAAEKKHSGKVSEYEQLLALARKGD